MGNLVRKISAMTFDGVYWSGWSNANGSNHVNDLEHAKELIKESTDIGWRIIDADNTKIYVSSNEHVENAIRSAKVNFNIDVPFENVFIGNKYLD